MYPKAIYLIDLLMEVDELIVGKAQIKYKSPKRILNSIQKMIELVGGTLSQRQHNLNRGFVVAKKNIVVSVWDISTIYNDTNNKSNNTNKEIFIFGGYWNSSSYVNISIANNSSPTTTGDQKNKKDNNDESIQSIINIPWKVIQKYKHSYVSSVNYQNGGLFMDDMYLNKLLQRQNTMTPDGSKNLRSNTTTTRSKSLLSDNVRSNVFDVSVGTESISNLNEDERIGLQFRNVIPSSLKASKSSVNDDDNDGNDLSCRFWKFSTGELLCFGFEFFFLLIFNNAFYRYNNCLEEV